jgi:uncharacterized membrane protein
MIEPGRDQKGQIKKQALTTAMLVILAGMAAGLAWWDWAYPTQLPKLLCGDELFAFYRQRLFWFLVGGVISVLLLWLISVYGQIRQRAVQRTTLIRPHIYEWLVASRRVQIWAFAPLLFMPLTVIRYVWLPLGMTYGSSFWAYLLVPPLAIALAAGFAPLIGICRTLAETPRPRIRPAHIVWILIGFYILLFGTLSIGQHLSFRTHALDLGTMAQATWNTAHGYFFEYTPFIEAHASDTIPISNRLTSGKLELIFLALAPFYRLWPNPVLLLIVQTLALGLSAWPLFLAFVSLEEKERGAEWVALLLTAAYLAYLPLHYLNMTAFHTNGLMPFFLTWALYAAIRERWRLYSLALLGALVCRADAAFVVGGLGLVLLICRKTVPGILSLSLSVSWFVFDFFVIVPWVESFYGLDPVGLVNQRFGQYGIGSGPLEILWGILHQPQELIKTLLARDKVQTGFDLLMPLGGLPLAGPLWLIPAVPVTLANLLASSDWQSSVRAHYFAPVPPFLFFAAGVAIHWISAKRDVLWRDGLSLYVLASTLMVGFFLSPFPPGHNFHLGSIWNRSHHHHAIARVLTQVSPDSALSAQSDLIPHVANRRQLYIFSTGTSTADEVLLDLDNAAERAPLDYFAFYQSVDRLMDNPEYGLVAWEDGVLLLRRGMAHDPTHLWALRRAYDEAFYRVTWLNHDAPTKMVPHELYPVRVCFKNEGSQGWRSQDWYPVFLAYHWLTEDGSNVVLWDSERTPFPFTLYPGRQLCLTALVVSPEMPGIYELQFDLVREDRAWFGDKDSEPFSVTVSVN